MTRFIKPLLALATLSFCFSPANAQGMSSDLAQLLQAPTQAPLQWLASTDAKGQNNDFVVLQPGQSQKIALPEGTLARLWSTATEPQNLELKLVNGQREPMILLAGGRAAVGQLRDKAYTLFPQITYEAISKINPKSFLIATNRAKTPSKWFYQIAVRPQNPAPLPLLPEASELSKREWKLQIAPGETKEIDSWSAPGLIYEFQVALDSGGAKGVFEKLRLLADWDGARGVDAPMMNLAGQMAGTEFVQNAVSDYDGAALKLMWPMPFQSAKLSLKNEGAQALNLSITARVQSFDKAPSEYRFCALQSSAQTQNGVPVSILKVQGAGAFVGLALSIAPMPDSGRQTFAYLEGNETISADGQKFEGTGTEDYFSSAWYFPEKPALNAYDGLTFKSAKPPAVAAYRFHVSDAIPFKKSLDFKFEHGKGNNTDDLLWQWTAFWYQKPPLNLGAATAGGDSGATEVSGNADSGAPNANSGNVWKILLAVIVGIGLGVFSALRKIRKQRAL